MHDSNALALQAFQAGARAFLLKSDANKMLMAAVKSLMVHKPFYAGTFSSELKGMPTGMSDPDPMLSPREKTIVKLVAEGYSNKGVSAILNLSIKTTETHRAAAMRKLNINSTAGLVRYAVRPNSWRHDRRFVHEPGRIADTESQTELVYSAASPELASQLRALDDLA